MKVHYLKPIQDRILYAKHAAEFDRKRIDFIEITKDEARELSIYLTGMFSFGGEDYATYKGAVASMYGIPLKVGDCK